MPFGKNNDIISPLKFDLPDLRSTKQGRFSDYMDDIPKMASITEKIDGEVIWFEDEANCQTSNDALFKKHDLNNFDNKSKMTFDSSNHTYKSGVPKINYDSYESTVPIISSLQISNSISDCSNSSKENVHDFVSNRKSASSSKKTQKIETRIRISSSETSMSHSSHKTRESSRNKHTASHLTTRDRDFCDQGMDLHKSKSCSDFPHSENLKMQKTKEKLPTKNLSIPNITVRKSRRSSKETSGYLEKLDEEEPKNNFNFSPRALDELLIEHQLRPNTLPLKSPIKISRVDQLILESGASPKKFDSSSKQTSNTIPKYENFAKNLTHGSNISTESETFTKHLSKHLPSNTENETFTKHLSKHLPSNTESETFTKHLSKSTVENENISNRMIHENDSVAGVFENQSANDSEVTSNKDAFADFLESVYDYSPEAKSAPVLELDSEVGMQSGEEILSNTQKVHASLDQEISAAISFEFDSIRQLLHDQHIARLKLHNQGMDEIAAMHAKTDALCGVIAKLLDENELLRHVVQQLQRS